MKLDKGGWFVLALMALVAYLLYKHFSLYGGHSATSPGTALSDAPVGSYYSNLFYGAYNPLRGTRPPIPETAFSTKA